MKAAIIAAVLALASLPAAAADWVQWKGSDIYIDLGSIVEGTETARFDFTSDFKTTFSVEVQCKKNRFSMTGDGDTIHADIPPLSPIAGIAKLACDPITP